MHRHLKKEGGRMVVVLSRMGFEQFIFSCKGYLLIVAGFMVFCSCFSRSELILNVDTARSGARPYWVPISLLVRLKRLTVESFQLKQNLRGLLENLSRKGNVWRSAGY
jgi:hypothetical protein